MESKSYFKAGLLALALTLTFVVSWEFYWRSKGFETNFNDDESIWAYYRGQVYESDPARPVVIGASRIKFDLDIPTWEKITGKQPIQLAMEGTNPRPFLADLAKDENFKGTVIVGMTDVLFFQPDHNHFEVPANKRIEKFHKWSISEQVSFRINKFLETNLLFLQESIFSLNSFLKRIPIESRPGVFVFPNFPMKFSNNQFNRQTIITDEFLGDTSQQAEVKRIWKMLVFTPKAASGGDTLDGIMKSVKADVDKIRARGGDVVFVREPSSGPYLEMELNNYPRALFWDRLLKETNCIGIHFADYPETANFVCPEWSHLAPKDAASYTSSLINQLEQKAGWKIKK